MSTITRGDPALLSRLPGVVGTEWLDGYDWMGRTEQKTPWHVPTSWGRDGWDLGEPPYSLYGWVDVPAEQYGACLHCGSRPGNPDSFNPCPGRPDGVHQDTDAAVFGYLSYCEGDITVVAYATREERDTALDEAFLFHMRNSSRGREILHLDAWARKREKDVYDLTPADLPGKYRGHFSWARLDREKPKAPCSHDSASGIDQTDLSDPTKVWRCDHCGVTWRNDEPRPIPLPITKETTP